MRLLAKNIQRVGEYKLENRPPDYPKTTRTSWKFAELDVKDAEPANFSGLASSRALHSTLQSESSNVLAAPTSVLSLAFADPNSKPGPKRPREDDCKVKARWSQDDLVKNLHTAFGKESTTKYNRNARHMEFPKAVPLNICCTTYEVTAKKSIQSPHVKLNFSPSVTSSKQNSYLYQFLQSIYIYVKNNKMNLSTIMFFKLTKRPRIWLALNFCCRLIPFLTFFRKKLEPQSRFPKFFPLFGGFQSVKKFFSPYIYIFICCSKGIQSEFNKSRK